MPYKDENDRRKYQRKWISEKRERQRGRCVNNKIKEVEMDNKKKFDMDFIEHGKDKIRDVEEQLEAIESKYKSQMAHYIKALDNNQLADMMWSNCNTADAQQLICEALARLLRKL